VDDVSSVTQAVRQLFGNIPLHTSTPEGWAVQHPATYTLVWFMAILIVFVPLTTRQFCR